MRRALPMLAAFLAGGLAFAQTPKKVLFDHTGWEDGGTSAYWIIDTHEPNPSPANPAVETDWNGGISCWAFDLLKKGYTVQALPATGGRITYGDTTNAQDLKNYAVYVIPECYRYFTTAEKQAIVAFVQAGGGLYMMGNHSGATRVTSSHPGSTDAFHVFNDLLANEASGFGFTYVVGHGPGDANANTTTTAITPGTGAIEQALVHGPNGLMTAMDFHSFAYINLTGSNPAAKWIVQTQVSGDPATDYFVVATTVGAGRVVAIGDSSPSDDGTTTTSGKSLIDGYHSNSSKAFHLNAVDWLASASAATGNTVTASITTPSSDVTVVSGISQAFAGTATDSSSSATLSYAWNFGDGATATGASTSHVFTNTGTSAVTRTVTFTATDNTGVSNSATRTITVSPETAGVVTANITTPSGNVTIASGASQAFAGTATDTSSTATLTYAWTFGDGATATGASTSHVFTNTGTSPVTRTVTFKATDSVGVSGTATRTVTVNPASTGSGTFAEVESNNTIATANAVAPSYSAITGNLTSSTDADYFALALQPGQKIAISMTGPSGPDWDLYLKSSTGSTLTSSTGSTTTESLSYTNTGTTVLTVYPEVVVYSGTSATGYKLALTYSGGSSGSNTVTASITTPSSNVTVASGTAQAFAGTAADSASGQSFTYSWAFGDGVSASGASASHTYTNTGATAVTYTATLTATDTTGAKGTATRTITVNPATTGGSAMLENFDSGTKTSYTAGTVALSTGSWSLSDALLGSTTSDPHDGTQSVRTRNSGTVTMLFDFPTGAKTVSLAHALYGTDTSATWSLWYSTNGGSSWTQAGGSVTTSSHTLATATFTVNVTGAIRFQIRKTDGSSNRVNFDDFSISGY
ncbi:MAG TPA: PKD domain-containing protein [Holophagaceae bacterium]|nr:PKD domain-containing protein [Holophagaceae bacterium]